MVTQPTTRRTTRYTLRARAQAVRLDGFALVGERVLDASPEGCLVACAVPVGVGERIIVSFQLPATGSWFDAEAEVVRVVRGRRRGDVGYAAGLRFVGFESADRLALGIDLREYPRVPAHRSPKARLHALAQR